MPRITAARRRLERDERRERLGPGVVVRQDGDAVDQRQPDRASGPGRAAGSSASGRAGSPSSGRRCAIAPAEQPATTAPRALRLGDRRPQRRAAQHVEQVPGMPAREVDEVGLADRLERRPVVALARRSGRAPARPPRRAPRSARRPSPPRRGTSPRRRARRRSAGSTTRGRDRPVASSSPRSNSAMGARNSPAPTSATGPGTAAAYGRARICEPDAAGSAAAWTLRRRPCDTRADG